MANSIARSLLVDAKSTFVLVVRPFFCRRTAASLWCARQSAVSLQRCSWKAKSTAVLIVVISVESSCAAAHIQWLQKTRQSCTFGSYKTRQFAWHLISWPRLESLIVVAHSGAIILCQSQRAAVAKLWLTKVLERRRKTASESRLFCTNTSCYSRGQNRKNSRPRSL